MGFEVLLGDSCYTPSEAQKLLVQINRKTAAAKVQQISGQWLYYVDLEGGKSGGGRDDHTLERVKQLVKASNSPTDDATSKPSDENAKTLKIYITPRNFPSPWSSKATSIADVCGVDARIERGRVVTIEFEEPLDDSELSFKDILHDRMTENFSQTLPEATTMFAEGGRGELVVVDIFSDTRGPLQALQDYNKEMGLGLDEPNMEYLVEQYRSLGRSPVCVPSSCLPTSTAKPVADIVLVRMTSNSLCLLKSIRSIADITSSTQIGPSTASASRGAFSR